MMPLAERRQQRSTNRAEALALLLEACRSRAGLAALVLADRDGFLVSASTSADAAIDPVVVAAHLPRTAWRERVPALTATTLKLGEHRLFFGAVGELPDEAARELYHAMRGTRRILG
jgi:hypothetical protein